jgi:3-oxoacyl-[acyl-carrier-protein] synthase II
MASLPRRVVITGASCVTSLGSSLSSTFTSLLSKKSGLRCLTPSEIFPYSDLKVKSVGPLDSFDLAYWSQEAGLLKNTLNALSASICVSALSEANWKPTCVDDQQATGIMLGLPVSAPEDLCRDVGHALEHGWAKLDRVSLLRVIPVLALGTAAIAMQISGFSTGYFAGNASGTNAIGQAYRSVGLGEAKVIVCGSLENGISPVALQALACADLGLNLAADEDPARASRPYDKRRNGWVLGLGGGALVLEDLEHALARGAQIYAEVAGYSLLSEAGKEHAAQGRGYYRAMDKARKQEKIDVVFGDAPGYAEWDEGEARAVEKMFGKNTLVANVKGALGHMQAASAGVSAAIAVYAIRNGVVPPIVNLEEPVNGNVEFVRDKVEREIETVLVNSANYDGTMFGSLMFKAFKR